jgi:hypothetical protein
VSVLAGLLAVAAFPAAWVAQRQLGQVTLLWAAVAAVPAALLGFVALSLARGVRLRSTFSLHGIPGLRTARLGRALGFLAVYGAVTVGLAMAFYALLATFGN